MEIKALKEGNQIPTSSKLLPLAPFINDDNSLCVGGRLKHAPMSARRRHPTVLSRHHHITRLIILHTHQKYLHGGPQLVIAAINQNYWIIRIRDAVRYEIKKCVLCTKHNPRTMSQQMGQLPAERVTPSPPLSKCGVDYAGPFSTRSPGRSKVLFKSYMAIFICFATNAVHLEVVSSLSTDAFIAALRRFISRRGVPTDIYSDCGTNFVGASKLLNDLLLNIRSTMQNEIVAKQCAEQGIQWHFNPASAPHFGGLWEAGVRSVKHHLSRVAGNATLTFEEMVTLLNQIEAILNSRPITPTSSDPSDLQVLTPAHFLIGRPLTALPDPDLQHINIGRLDRWQIIQQQQQQFWKRWSCEYISRLQERPKWMKITEEIKIDDLVIIKDERLPPLKWKLGRVITTHPGKDCLTRVVTLKTTEGQLKRPITKIC